MNRSVPWSDTSLEDAATVDPDRALVDRIAAGSEEAMTELYGRHARRLHAFAVARLRDPAAAADVLSEVMVEVWRRADRFEGRARVSTWLFGIAHHKVIDELRRRGARGLASADDDEAAGLPDLHAVDPVRAIDAAGEAERLRRCLERLGDSHREAVHLAFFEDLSCAEIAEIAACPIGTVKTRLFHAKRLLKRCLGGETEGSDAGA